MAKLSEDMKIAGEIKLPRKLFKNNFGFGIDFGSSILKMVYTEEVGEYLHVHLTNFPRDNFGQMLQFLQGKYEQKLNPGGEYHTTGIGVGDNVQDFEKTLGVKCKIGNEEAHMIDAFNFLAKNVPWEQFVYSANLKIREDAAKATKTFCDEILPSIFPSNSCERYHWNGSDATQPMSRDVQYPAILSLVGSGHYIDKVEENGRYSALDFYTIAGRTFLGLGKLLTGAESYEEVVTLAASGCAANVDQSLTELESSQLVPNTVIKGFSFGSVATDENQDSFKREDIAAALVSMIANSAAQDAYNWSKIEDIHQVFFIGGVMANNDMFRREVEKEFFLKCYVNEKHHLCDCLFVRCGGHLPALGSLLLNLEII